MSEMSYGMRDIIKMSFDEIKLIFVIVDERFDSDNIWSKSKHGLLKDFKKIAQWTN